MHMRKNLLAVLVAGFLGMPALAGAQAPAASEEGLARGLMLSHEGRMIFSPCRERSYVEVEDVSPGGVVTSALKKLGLSADKPLYAELFGEADNGTLRTKGINFAHVQARCGAPLPGTGPWRAVGRNPAWSMITAEDKLRLHVEGHPAAEVSFTENLDDPAVTRLEVEGGQWELRQQVCFHPDNRLLSGWAITGEFRGKALNGCAWKP